MMTDNHTNKKSSFLNQLFKLPDPVVDLCLLLLLIMFSLTAIKSKMKVCYSLRLQELSKEQEEIDPSLYFAKEQEKTSLSFPPPEEDFMLTAVSACLMDGSTKRVLYGKDCEEKLSMASTTKIMTLLVTLENANLSDVVTVSKNAARQPDVQLNICTGEQYILKDLLYSLMLESHNDTAVAIAEHVGGSVEQFCNMMTKRAHELGAVNTQFKTPNGLDAEGHYTTAHDLSLLACYALSNPTFCDIIQTPTYQFDSVDQKRSFTVNNHNRFLYMMDGAIGVKTGFTNQAGYCFVGAIKKDDKLLVSTVLGSGWPPHKEYKWADTKKLMLYGLNQFEVSFLFQHIAQEDIVTIPNTITVYQGKEEFVTVRPEGDLRNEKMLMRPSEKVTMEVKMLPFIKAPVKKGTLAGYLTYYIDGNVYERIKILTTGTANETDFAYLLKQILKVY